MPEGCFPPPEVLSHILHTATYRTEMEVQCPTMRGSASVETGYGQMSVMDGGCDGVSLCPGDDASDGELEFCSVRGGCWDGGW